MLILASKIVWQEQCVSTINEQSSLMLIIHKAFSSHIDTLFGVQMKKHPNLERGV